MMRTENLAIVFIDIAGFTARSSAQTREENQHMLRRFDGVVRPLVRAYDGRVVKTIGDAYLVTFRSPTNALLCSMGVHDRLAETNAGFGPAAQFAIRTAANVGDVRIERGDVFGEAVNVASRIEGQAGAGEIHFSEAAYLAIAVAIVALLAWGLASKPKPATPWQKIQRNLGL
jgi:adenylate cyclase